MVFITLSHRAESANPPAQSIHLITPDKTGQHRFSRHQPERNGTFSFLGFQYRWRATRTGKSKVQRGTDPRKLQKSTAAFKEWIKTTRHRRLDRLMPQLRQKMSGYWNYYGISGNFARLRQFWWQSLGLLYKWLNRRSHKPGFTWKKLMATLCRYEIPGPHIRDRSVTASSAPSGAPHPSTTEASILRLHA